MVVAQAATGVAPMATASSLVRPAVPTALVMKARLVAEMAACLPVLNAVVMVDTARPETCVCYTMEEAFAAPTCNAQQSSTAAPHPTQELLQGRQIHRLRPSRNHHVRLNSLLLIASRHTTGQYDGGTSATIGLFSKPEVR
jgi:hypothetical protein